MEHRLLLIDGPSTVGKSSLSKQVFQQITRQTPAYWLHEECQNHPVRQEEFSAGDLHTNDGMEQNRRAMLAKWDNLRAQMERSNQICVAEGCFLHSIDRYLLKSVWNQDEILHYCQQAMDVLKPLNPLLVFLHRPDIQESFEKAFAARGDWWKELILSVPETEGYFSTHTYTGENSIYASLADEQEQMASIFERLCCDKIRIDTTQEHWNQYTRHITEAAGYHYQTQEVQLPDMNEYCGKYQIAGGTDTWSIQYDSEKGQLYTSLFWPYMPMRYNGNGQFELVSFPVELQFEADGMPSRFRVSGNYDWDYNEKLFCKLHTDS